MSTASAARPHAARPDALKCEMCTGSFASRPIVNVSSIYGVIGSKGSTAYHAAKGAVLMLTKAAAVQYAPENIRVNTILPGFADTPFVGNPSSSPGFDPSRISERIPLGRFAIAEDIAHGMVFLASDESSFVTGAELAIDGGMAAI